MLNHSKISLTGYPASTFVSLKFVFNKIDNLQVQIENDILPLKIPKSLLLNKVYYVLPGLDPSHC